MTTAHLVVAFGAILLGACGTDDDGIVDAGRSSPDAVAGAQAIDFNESKVDVLDPEGDSDLFVFEAAEGDWIGIDVEPIGIPVFLARARLYDMTRTQVAEGQYIATRLKESGMYFVEVFAQEGSAGTGGPSHDYTLRVRMLVGASDVVVDAELGDDELTATPISFDGVSWLLGGFEHLSDVDVFAFDIASAGVSELGILLDGSGPSGNGSSAMIREVSVLDSSGAVEARVPGNALALALPLRQGRHYLFVSRDGGSAGLNDFYVLQAEDVIPVAAEREVGSGQNDFLADAESSGEIVDVELSTAAFFTFLPDGDIDWIGMDVPAGSSLAAYCEGEGIGSGVRGLRIDLHDGAAFVSSTFDEGNGVVLSSTTISSGRAWFVLSKGTQDPTIDGNFARCAATVL